jgi:hypothetical protein
MIKKQFKTALFLPLLICIAVSSCSSSGFRQSDAFAETVFEAYLPEPLGDGEIIYLEMLDELTGIALNPTRFEMEAKDDFTFFIRIPLAINSLVKYRFIKAGTSNSIEISSTGLHTHYRVYKVDTAAIVPNIISGWHAEKYFQGAGEVSGYIFDSVTEAPIPEVMVHLNGLRVITSHDGFYKFENVPGGELHLTAFHPEGKYLPFQQKAIVTENAVTPASFGMSPAKFVDIQFVVTAPDNTTIGSPIRILGDLYQFGDSFNELNGGSSIISSRAPILELQKDGTYETSLSLPAGLTFNYKYSLGDGFINAEHYLDGQFRVRTLQIPNRNETIQNEIESWHSGDSRMLSFNITTPENTPVADVLSIQLNPFSWMEPIPTWKKSDNQWTFNLYSPMEYLAGAQYRFCRNEQCGSADDSITAGENPIGYKISFENLDKLSIHYDLQEWYGLDEYQYEVLSGNSSEQMYLSKFGFEIAFPYDLHWNNYWRNGLIEAGVSGAQWIILSPSWTFENNANHSAGLLPGRDPLASDIDQLMNLVNDAGMQLAIFPQPYLAPTEFGYWEQAPLTYNWWQDWFEDYRRFILNYADYAELRNIPNLIIGGDGIAPAIPGGSLPNGVPSNQPVDMNEKWLKLIEQVRSRYHGVLGFALPYPIRSEATSGILSNVDEIYIEISSPLASSDSPSAGEIESRMGKFLDEEIYQLYATYSKPVTLGIYYPSIDGGASGCLNFGKSCDRVMIDSDSNVTVDAIEQADVYQGILRAVVQRPWVSGVFSKGFNPSVAVVDTSSSIHGKPAMEVISYYFRNAQ